jgi:hypothetical protein
VKPASEGWYRDCNSHCDMSARRVKGSAPRRRRSHGWHYRVYWNALLFVLIGAALIARAIVNGKREARNGLIQSVSEPIVRHGGQQRNISSDITAAFDPRKRRLYPYSVVPGGVENISELRSAIVRDPLVAAHYASFDLSRAQIVHLDRNEAVHVSFRLNDRIYWTKKTLTLHKGETVVTDGVHEARTRCGNRISVAPEEPVSPVEPPAQAMEAAPRFLLVAEVPEIWPTPDPVTPPVFETPASALSPTLPGWLIPPRSYPTAGKSPRSTAPVKPPLGPPPVATPEPGTFALLALGLFPVGWLAWVAKKSRSSGD